MATETKQYLTPTEVAQILSVSPITVRQWAQKGLLAAHTTAGGHRRFAYEEIAKFAKQRGIPFGVDTCKVLIVDDDPQLKNFLVALFTTNVDDIEVYAAADGFEAGRLVQQHKPDIVVLDIMMPGMDGIEVCRSIKQDASSDHALVIAMTGHHSESVEQRVLAAGASKLLKKPFDNNELLTSCGFASQTTD